MYSGSNHFEDDAITEDGVLDHADRSAADLSIQGTALIVPLDAAIPSELLTDALPTGTLYERLRYLNDLEGQDYAFVPITGGEMLALERSWKALVSVKKVAVLTELPGARYDVVFDQAKRQIGLRSIDWPSASELLISEGREKQRTRDSKPWSDPSLVSLDEEPRKRVGKPRNPSTRPAPIAPPLEDFTDEGDVE